MTVVTVLYDWLAACVAVHLRAVEARRTHGTAAATVPPTTEEGEPLPAV